MIAVARLPLGVDPLLLLSALFTVAGSLAVAAELPSSQPDKRHAAEKEASAGQLA
jgi:hypothetical protein